MRQPKLAMQVVSMSLGQKASWKPGVVGAQTPLAVQALGPLQGLLSLQVAPVRPVVVQLPPAHAACKH